MSEAVQAVNKKCGEFFMRHPNVSLMFKFDVQDTTAVFGEASQIMSFSLALFAGLQLD